MQYGGVSFYTTTTYRFNYISRLHRMLCIIPTSTELSPLFTTKNSSPLQNAPNRRMQSLTSSSPVALLCGATCSGARPPSPTALPLTYRAACRSSCVSPAVVCPGEMLEKCVVLSAPVCVYVCSQRTSKNFSPSHKNMVGRVRKLYASTSFLQT